MGRRTDFGYSITKINFIPLVILFFHFESWHCDVTKTIFTRKVLLALTEIQYWFSAVSSLAKKYFSKESTVTLREKSKAHFLHFYLHFWCLNSNITLGYSWIIPEAEFDTLENWMTLCCHRQIQLLPKNFCSFTLSTTDDWSRNY